MTEKVFKIKTIRLFEEWIAPIVLLIIISFFVYEVYHQKDEDYVFKIVAFFIIAIIFLGPFFFLFFNHLSKSLKTELKVNSEFIELTQKGKSCIIDLTDIETITVYSINGKYGPGKLPWSDIFKWKVKSYNSEIIFSSLLISESNFKKLLKKELIYKFDYMPTM